MIYLININVSILIERLLTRIISAATHRLHVLYFSPFSKKNHGIHLSIVLSQVCLLVKWKMYPHHRVYPHLHASAKTRYAP